MIRRAKLAVVVTVFCGVGIVLLVKTESCDHSTGKEGGGVSITVPAQKGSNSVGPAGSSEGHPMPSPTGWAGSPRLPAQFEIHSAQDGSSWWKKGAREHYQRAVGLNREGQHRGAAEEFKTAYAIQKNPSILYDIAESYRLAGNTSDALGAYRKYIDRLPNASNRREVDEKMAGLENLEAPDGGVR